MAPPYWLSKEILPRELNLQLLVPIRRLGETASTNTKSIEWGGVKDERLANMSTKTLCRFVVSQHRGYLHPGDWITSNSKKVLDIMKTHGERNLNGVILSGILQWDAEMVETLNFAMTKTSGLKLRELGVGIMGSVYTNLLAVACTGQATIEFFSFDCECLAFPENYHPRILWNAIGHMKMLTTIELNVNCGSFGLAVDLLCDELETLPNLKAIKVGPKSYEGLLENDNVLLSFVRRVSKYVETLEIVSGLDDLPVADGSERYWVARGRIRRFDFEALHEIVCNPECRLRQLKMDWVWLSSASPEFLFQNGMKYNLSLERLDLRNCIHPTAQTMGLTYDIPQVLGNICDLFLGVHSLDLSDCCIGDVGPLRGMYSGADGKLETLWLCNNSIGYNEFHRFVWDLHEMDVDGKHYSLKVVNLTNNPFDRDRRYASDYLETMSGSRRLVDIVVASWERTRSVRVYAKSTSHSCINQFWRGDDAMLEIEDKLPLGIWKYILNKSQVMKPLKRVTVDDASNLRGPCYIASTTKSIERDKLDVLYYMVRNVMSRKLEHWATAGVESSNERKLRRRLFH